MNRFLVKPFRPQPPFTFTFAIIIAAVCGLLKPDLPIGVAAPAFLLGLGLGGIAAWNKALSAEEDS